MENQNKYSRLSKESMSKELHERFEKYPNFILSNYFGLSSFELDALRRELRKVTSSYFVVKNTIASRTLANLNLSEVGTLISGGVGVVFIGGDALEASKSLVGFSRKHKPFQLTGGYIDGQIMDVGMLKKLASLPSREALLAMIAMTMKSPITGFVGVLGGVLRKFVYVISAIRNKKA